MNRGELMFCIGLNLLLTSLLIGAFSIRPARADAPYLMYVTEYRQTPLLDSNPQGRLNVVVTISKLINDGSSDYDWYFYSNIVYGAEGIRLETVPGIVAYGSNWLTAHTIANYTVYDPGTYRVLEDYGPTSLNGFDSNTASVSVDVGTPGGGVGFSQSYTYQIPWVDEICYGDLSQNMAVWRHDFQTEKHPTGSSIDSTYTARPSFIVRTAENAASLVDGWHEVEFGHPVYSWWEYNHFDSGISYYDALGYTLSISASNGGTTNPLPGLYSYMVYTSVPVNAISWSGYYFDHWLLDGTVYSTSPITVMMIADHSLTAYFSPNPTLTISVSGSGTTNPTPGSHSYDYGASVPVTATASIHYSFDHWSLDGITYTNNPITVQMVANHILTAYFAPIPQETLTINSNTGGTTSPPAGAYTYYYGTQVSVAATGSGGYDFDFWFLDGTLKYDNPIWVQMTANRTLTPYYSQAGGCPYVYAWNGTGYAKDNNILPATETGNGTDTKDDYLLQQPLVPLLRTRQTSLYSLQICEFESEIDYIDQVKLIAVDHSPGTSVAVTPEGEILTYSNPTSPVSGIDNNGVDRLSEIATMNGNVSDPSTYFQGNKGDWLLLNFGKVTGPTANLILRDDMLCQKETCINVQVQNANGVWQTVEALLHPRAFWSIEAVNMTAYVPKTGDFQIRLLWTASHRLDYVGLDTSSPAQIKVTSKPPILAVHSTMGEVTAKLLYDDEQCVKLVNGQQITMAFMLPNNAQGTTRDFIFYVDGYYYTIIP